MAKTYTATCPSGKHTFDGSLKAASRAALVWRESGCDACKAEKRATKPAGR